MNDADKHFIGHAVAECAMHGMKILFLPKSFVYADSAKCSGYFDEDARSIIVATKNPQRDWMPTFIHEFCHFRQFIEKDPVLNKISNSTRIDHDMWDWIDGRNIPMPRVRKSVRAFQEMELNCEKRVVDIINNFGLSIIVEDYIRMANTYVLFYGMILKTRRWYVTPPYQSTKLLKTIPDKFVTSFKLPDKFEEIVLKECY